MYDSLLVCIFKTRNREENGSARGQIPDRKTYYLTCAVLDGPNLLDLFTVFSVCIKVTLGFVDPCTLPNHPGWPLRNFLAFVGFHWLDVTNILFFM